MMKRLSKHLRRRDRSRRRGTAASALAGLLLIVGCAPRLVVRHEDPTYPRAMVQVDGELVGIVDSGDELSVRLDEGLHQVVVNPMGSDANPWSDDGGPWLLYLDSGTYITLLPSTR